MKKWKPIEVTETEMIFGSNALNLIPKFSEIPVEFVNGNTKWNKIFNDWFFNGLRNVGFIPKENINLKIALRHIKTIMGSYEPQHEHKEAAVAYLLSEFFDDITYDLK
jgi:hypothetical protein